MVVFKVTIDRNTREKNHPSRLYGDICPMEFHFFSTINSLIESQADVY